MTHADSGILSELKAWAIENSYPLPSSNYELVIICVNTNHPGNLGAICRTMLNYGFANLRLVNPDCSPDDIEARNRAKHAGSILDDVKIFDNLLGSVSDCSLVVGKYNGTKWAQKLHLGTTAFHGSCLKSLLTTGGKLP